MSAKCLEQHLIGPHFSNLEFVFMKVLAVHVHHFPSFECTSRSLNMCNSKSQDCVGY